MNKFDLRKFLVENRRVDEQQIEEFAAGTVPHQIARYVMQMDNMLQARTEDPQEKIVASDLKREIFKLLHTIE
jgi:hypothetical protein